MTVDSGRRSRRLDQLWPRPRPVVMGILNCTPDSFSDGGRHFEPGEAIRGGLEMLAHGADIIDIGGESTRPGALAVDTVEESRRVVPVISELRNALPDAVLSVDTSKIEVAAAALEAGADIVNDVTAGSAPGMHDLVAEHGAAIVLMHMRGEPRTMQTELGYRHVVAEVHGHLVDRAAAALAAGIPHQRVWLDPGIGFGKNDDGNLALLGALPDLASHGHPVLVGPSNKSFIGRLTGAPVDDRLPGTLGALIAILEVPRAVVRVHDPAAAAQFLEIAVRVREVSA
ncbi:MAG: dihydropteroate synthase [Thermoanaerobaculales bacterium]|nr:dihydropteroate synthase [Thermoanaerobaculales bacterium]